MRVLGNRVLVSHIEKEKKEGFETVDVQDDFIYRGRIEHIGAAAQVDAGGNYHIGDTIIFAKYSPDTHEVEIDGIKYKSVAVPDIIAII